MEMVHYGLVVEIDIKGNIKEINVMVMENIYLQTVTVTKDSSSKIINMAKAYSTTAMDTVSKAGGRMVNMLRASSSILMAKPKN